MAGRKARGSNQVDTRKPQEDAGVERQSGNALEPIDEWSASAAALKYLQSIVEDVNKPDAMRMRAAQTLAQYTRAPGAKPKDVGKKQARQEAAEGAASSGRFAPAQPPRLKAVK